MNCRALDIRQLSILAVARTILNRIKCLSAGTMELILPRTGLHCFRIHHAASSQMIKPAKMVKAQGIRKRCTMPVISTIAPPPTQWKKQDFLFRQDDRKRKRWASVSRRCLSSLVESSGSDSVQNAVRYR